jgi:hypothetical protein
LPSCSGQINIRAIVFENLKVNFNVQQMYIFISV